MKKTIYNSPKMNKMFQDAEKYIAYTKLKEYYDILYEELKISIKEKRKKKMINGKSEKN